MNLLETMTMNKEEFDSLIKEVLSKGIQVTLKLEEETLWFNLHTDMKSGLEIAFVSDNCIYRGRYNEIGSIYSKNDLLLQVKNCLHNNNYGNQFWLDWLVKENILTKTVKNIVTYS